MGLHGAIRRANFGSVRPAGMAVNSGRQVGGAVVTAPAIVITFLGTGSGVPTLERNLASVALQRQGELFLFDCGEAAQVQYRRAALGFGSLRAIFISHMHGDHVTGLLGLLMSLQMSDRQEPLTVYGPPGIRNYVRENQRLLSTGFAYKLHFHEEEQAATLIDNDGYLIRCRPLEHRSFCLGFRFEEKSRPGRFSVEKALAMGIPEGPLFGALQRGQMIELEDGRTIQPDEVLGSPRPGVSVAYVTDTRPCPAAVELAQGVDVLIHEATFGAELADDAAKKSHCTTTEAAEIARLAGVRQLLLTHISPRYGDVRELAAEARAVFPESWIVRDLYRYEVFHREAGEEPALGEINKE